VILKCAYDGHLTIPWCHTRGL